ncbi:porin [Comamonas sp. NoAH]|uniref:porin n=1 Tax=Comamonas halotolerans TaxID=3041496 RepID=UPI0024E105D4|nr:porin [Comamonas sp. NoAH]
MKYALILAAACAASSSLAAPSSQVAIFGTVDLGLVQRNDGQTLLHGAPANTALHVMPGARSRIGFRGMEDLGRGLRAHFVLEHSFTPDNGHPMSSAMFWHAQSWVGLSGGFGEVRLGRDYAPAHQMTSRADPFAFDTVAQVGIAQAWLGYTSSGGASRMNNALHYRTPNYQGLSAQLAVSFSEQEGVSNERGASISYEQGPWYAGLGWDRKDARQGHNDLWILTGNYRWDRWVFRASHTRVRVQDQARRNWTLGASYRDGAGEVLAVVTQQKLSSEMRTQKWGVGYHHWLSKRTKIYTDVARAKGRGLSATTGMDVGLHHRF